MRIMQHLTAISILCIATLVYGLANAHVFLQDYDRNYIKDLYEHSQWSYKTAVRSIGDDGLYQAAAIRILESGKIYTINPEVPTAGIYLYVASIYLFNNPYILNPLVYLLTGYLVYLLARQITTPQCSLFAVTLFAIDPFLGSQLGLTMLDLPLLFWILLAVYTTIRTSKTHNAYPKIFFAILCGVAYGTAAATKFGLLIPAIFLTSSWLFFLRRKILALTITVFIAIATYLVINLPYLLQTNSLLSLLELEKFRFGFYRQGLVPYFPGVAIFGLILPIYWSWWGSGLQINSAYSLLWPAAFVTVIWYFLQHTRSIWAFTIDGIGLYIPSLQKQRKWYETSVETDYTLKRRMMYLTLTALIILLFFAIIPFWTRYYIALLPLLYLISAAVLPSVIWATLSRRLLLSLFFVLQLVLIFFQLRPGPQPTVSGLEKFFTHSTYQDVYMSLHRPELTGSSRLEFWRTLLNMENELHLQSKHVEIKVPYIPPWQDSAIGEIETKYSTYFGEFRHRTPLELRRHYNKWELVWRDDYLLLGYQRGDRVVVEYTLPSDGQITDQSGRLVSSYQEWPIIEVLPARILDEPLLQDQIALLTGLDRHVIKEKYRRNSPLDSYTKVDFVLDSHSPAALLELQNNPAVRLHQIPKRVHHPELSPQKLAQLQEFLTARSADYRFSINSTTSLHKNNGTKTILYQTSATDTPNVQIDL